MADGIQDTTPLDRCPIWTGGALCPRPLPKPLLEPCACHLPEPYTSRRLFIACTNLFLVVPCCRSVDTLLIWWLVLVFGVGVGVGLRFGLLLGPLMQSTQ